MESFEDYKVIKLKRNKNIYVLGKTLNKYGYSYCDMDFLGRYYSNGKYLISMENETGEIVCKKSDNSWLAVFDVGYLTELFDTINAEPVAKK